MENDLQSFLSEGGYPLDKDLYEVEVYTARTFVYVKQASSPRGRRFIGAFYIEPYEVISLVKKK